MNMPAPSELGLALLALARTAIGDAFGLLGLQVAATPQLAERGATFVTLRHTGELRGCIGTVTAWRALADDVRGNAVAAAFHDPRFAPLTRSEFDETWIEVSLLAPHQRIAAADEASALAQLRCYIDGVVFECGRRRATFLPQVWEQLPDPRAFLAALKRKAGLAEDFWSDEVRLSRYVVEKFVERAPARTLQ
jgi:AmmeMemoRadiSam system protein A